jgi:hypothetical protein
MTAAGSVSMPILEFCLWRARSHTIKSPRDDHANALTPGHSLSSAERYIAMQLKSFDDGYDYYSECKTGQQFS